MNSHRMFSLWLTILFQAIAMFASIPRISAISTRHHWNGVRRLADSTDTSGYISIDCGATGPHQSNYSYDSDEGYIATGKNMVVDPSFDGYDLMLRTVRSFPEGERNCYTLKPINGRKNNYLIRAWFLYGNYDGKSKTPTFDIYIGVNYYATIKESSKIIEILHKPTTDFIYFCLVNTGEGTPFISGLDLRPLDDSLYDVSESASLFLYRRYSTGRFGEDSDQYYSYLDDVYDRLWAQLPPNGWSNYTTNTDLSSLKNDAYKVPPSIFRTGAIPIDGSRTFDYFYTPNGPLLETYFYFHFAETLEETNTQSRIFNIYINGKSISEPIKLPYLEAFTLASSPTKLQPGDSSIWVSFNKTFPSMFPPILNAFEVYTLINLPQSATNPDDSNAIMDIKTMYGSNGIMNAWQGDPCLPKSPWPGLNCSDNGNDSPTIISLNLSSMGLIGGISPSLFSLKLLKNLNLSNNNLSGAIPEFLSEMPSLQDLDLSGNNLDGSVPIKLTNRMKSGSLSLRVDGNPNLCTSDTCAEGSKKDKVLIPVVAASALLVLLIAVAGVVVLIRKAGFFNSYKKGGIKSKNRKFTRSEVINMTNDFQTEVGKGGYGNVYYGSLNDGTEVAVKRLNPSPAFSIESFHSEVELLMIVHHRNLVSLVGYCEEEAAMSLIFEYMANGNLQEYLKGSTDILSWKQRLQIMIDTAKGLDYLHNECRPAIVHRDMKPANILLDNKLRAKIADFGLSRSFSSENQTHIMTINMAGTHGYLDPEFGALSRLTEKSDVYSFGIIMLQLITGQQAFIESIHIVDWVKPYYSRRDINGVVDKQLEGDFSKQSIWQSFDIAINCVSSVSVERPDMTNVSDELKRCMELEKSPLKQLEEPSDVVNDRRRHW